MGVRRGRALCSTIGATIFTRVRTSAGKHYCSANTHEFQHTVMVLVSLNVPVPCISGTPDGRVSQCPLPPSCEHVQETVGVAQVSLGFGRSPEITDSLKLLELRLETEGPLVSSTEICFVEVKAMPVFCAG